MPVSLCLYNPSQPGTLVKPTLANFSWHDLSICDCTTFADRTYGKCLSLPEVLNSRSGKMQNGAYGNGRTIGLEFDVFQLFNTILEQIIDLNRIWETPLENACTDSRFSTVRKPCAQERQLTEGWLAEPNWVGAVRRPLTM